MTPAHLCTLSKSSRCGVTMTKKISLSRSVWGLVTTDPDVVGASASKATVSFAEPSLDADRSLRWPRCSLRFGCSAPVVVDGDQPARNETYTCKNPSELYFGKQIGSHEDEEAAALAERDFDDNVLRRTCKSEG